MKQKATSSLLFYFGILAVLAGVLIVAIESAVACSNEPGTREPVRSDAILRSSIEPETREPIQSGANPRSSIEIPSNQNPDASVSGTVAYRERLALTPDAKLVVELRNVSLFDAAAPLIARKTITNPGQVPIEFKVEYSRQDIDSRNTYEISATIFEADGRMAFTNDIAYDVITRGNPDNVDMVLVQVEPPPDSGE